MRILQVGKFYPPSHGGIETLLQSLAEGLRHAGDDVTVLCSSHEHLPEKSIQRGVRVHRSLRIGTLLSQPLTPALPWILRSESGNFDLVHVHGPNPLMEAAVLALPRSVPVVASYHSDVVRQRWALPAYGPLLHAFLSRCDRVVVATRQHIESSPFLPRHASRIDVIPYGIDPAPFEITNAVREKVESLRRTHGKFVLFVGRLVSYKGVRYLISAMKDLDAKLCIVGDGPIQDELKRHARSEGLAERVRFLGPIGHSDDLAALYHACGVVCLPSVSTNEAFGLVQVEAMACSKPTVVSRLQSGISTVQEDGITGLYVPPESPRALAQAIGTLLADDFRRDRMGRAARERFEALYSQSAMVTAMRSLYSAILSARS